MRSFSRSSGQSLGSSYRRDIDGLRAIAVLAVVLYHLGIPGVPGGFVGVDIFFVISGYLISRLLFAEFEERRFSLIQFYERRARRILPALCVMLAVTSAIAYILFYPTELEDFAASPSRIGAFFRPIIIFISHRITLLQRRSVFLYSIFGRLGSKSSSTSSSRFSCLDYAVTPCPFVKFISSFYVYFPFSPRPFLPIATPRWLSSSCPAGLLSC